MKKRAEARKTAFNRHMPITEHRHFIRHPLCFPLRYKLLTKASGSTKLQTSKTINISMGGLLFAAKQAVEKGATISVDMPFQDKIFHIKAKVAHCSLDTETHLYNIGVQFYRLNDAFKVKLIEQVYLISEFRDLWSVQLGREVTLEEASREWIKRYSDRFRRLYW